MNPVYVRLDRIEGYEDVCSELLIEDAVEWPSYEDVTEEVEGLRAELDEVIAETGYGQAITVRAEVAETVREFGGDKFAIAKALNEARSHISDVCEWVNGNVHAGEYSAASWSDKEMEVRREVASELRALLAKKDCHNTLEIRLKKAEAIVARIEHLCERGEERAHGGAEEGLPFDPVERISTIRKTIEGKGR